MKNTLKTVAGVTLHECESETFRTCIDDAIFKGVNLDNADLSGQDLEGINLSGQSIRWANFENARLAFANLQGCNLNGSNFRRTNLFSSNLQGAYMKGTDIHGANFSNANLKNVDFRRDVLNKQITSCKNASFAHSDMTSIVIESYEFYDCNFSGAKIQKSTIKYTMLDACNLRETDLTGAILYDFNVRNSDLTNVRLRAVNLTKTDFHNCDLSSAYLRFTTLPIGAGMKMNKTNSDQRIVIANLLQNWLKYDAENLSDNEKELLQLLNEYGSDINYTAALDRMKSRNR